MAESAELAFVKVHLNTIGSLPVQYADDYQQPPQNSLRKLPIVPVRQFLISDDVDCCSLTSYKVDLPDPPARKTDSETTTPGKYTL